MGSGASSHEGIRKEWMNVFHAMQFTTPEVKHFYDIYNTIDTDHSGSIEVAELLKFLDIENSLFTERIFAAFDKDGTGQIDFFEFVVSLWKFCALGKESINIFAFDLFDTDGDGALTEIEVKVMFHDLYWYGTEPKEDEQSRRTLHALISAGENFITIEEFRPFCETHQSLLNPLFAVQDKLRAAAMGTAFWENMSKRKIMLGHGHEVPLNELMVRSSDREDFEKILQEKSKGVRGMMRAMFQSGEHTEASSGGGHFNPFKSTGSNSKDEHHSSKLPTIVLNNNSSHGSVETGTLGQ